MARMCWSEQFQVVWCSRSEGEGEWGLAALGIVTGACVEYEEVGRRSKSSRKHLEHAHLAPLQVRDSRSTNLQLSPRHSFTLF